MRGVLQSLFRLFSSIAAASIRKIEFAFQPGKCFAAPELAYKGTCHWRLQAWTDCTASEISFSLSRILDDKLCYGGPIVGVGLQARDVCGIFVRTQCTIHNTYI